MLPKIALLVGVLGLVAALVACSAIAGLGPPLGQGTDAGDKPDASLSEAGDPDADAGPPDSSEEAEAEAAAIVGDAGWPDAPPGALDPTFGDGGTVIPSPGYIGPHGLAVQPENGNIVFCGAIDNIMYGTYVLLIGRLLPDGSNDTSFDYSGHLTAEPPNTYGVLEACNAVALVPGESIVAAGYTNVAYVQGSNNQIFAARYTKEGQVDPSLGMGSGFAGIVFPYVNAQANAMVLQSDDSMILAGALGTGAGSPALAHLSGAGAVDSAFGADAGRGSDAGLGFETGPGYDGGPAPVDILAAGDAGQITQLFPRSTGGYVATAQATGFLSLGITPAGGIDPSYGVGGQAWAAVQKPLVAPGAVDMVIQSDGATVCVGSTVEGIELVRFTAGGQLDTTFGGANTGHASLLTPLAANAIALLPDGFAVAVLGSGGVAGAARFDKDGLLDTSFGKDGFALFNVTVNVNSEAIAVDSTGRRIYVAVGADSGMMIMRIML
jgi:uncharacterized delta-60 repeat protein